jgi:hypothetical protein
MNLRALTVLLVLRNDLAQVHEAASGRTDFFE